MERLYDLMLLLDSDAPSERRQEILRSVESAIEAKGSIETNADWGVRRLSYEIDHRAEAEYHLLQFRGSPDALETLERTLRFADGVIRFRIIKVKPGTPPPPTPRAAAPTDAEPRARGASPPAEAEPRGREPQPAGA